MDHKSFKIYAFYFLLNKAMQINGQSQENHFSVDDTCITRFLRYGILTDEAIGSLTVEWKRYILAKESDNLIRSAMYIIDYDIDFCSIDHEENWIIMEQFACFLKEYIIPMDIALRAILIQNFVYAPLCTTDCTKPCPIHCNNNCHYGLENDCLFSGHTNDEDDGKDDEEDNKED